MITMAIYFEYTPIVPGLEAAQRGVYSKSHIPILINVNITALTLLLSLGEGGYWDYRKNRTHRRANFALGMSGLYVFYLFA